MLNKSEILSPLSERRFVRELVYRVNRNFKDLTYQNDDALSSYLAGLIF